MIHEIATDLAVTAGIDDGVCLEPLELGENNAIRIDVTLMWLDEEVTDFILIIDTGNDKENWSSDTNALAVALGTQSLVVTGLDCRYVRVRIVANADPPPAMVILSAIMETTHL